MSSLRRLAKDHSALRCSLPPNYLFPAPDDPAVASFPDDLSHLLIYLTGPTGTPFSHGLFLLHIRIPTTYPSQPPTVTFRTKIFHPNVDPKTGAVCLETLKRDWDPKLTLKDILITIGCLLVQPNPDSALNENAGVLVREDYEGFERQARLMTKIHAGVPKGMRDEVDQARRRGEEPGSGIVAASKEDSAARKAQKDNSDSAKENYESRAMKSSRVENKAVLGKRPLTDVPPPVAAVTLLPNTSAGEETSEPQRKSPKHHHSDTAHRDNLHVDVRDDQGNDSIKSKAVEDTTTYLSKITTSKTPARTLSSIGPIQLRTYARIGIRRL